MRFKKKLILPFILVFSLFFVSAVELSNVTIGTSTNGEQLYVGSSNLTSVNVSSSEISFTRFFSEPIFTVLGGGATVNLFDLEAPYNDLNKGGSISSDVANIAFILTVGEVFQIFEYTPPVVAPSTGGGGGGGWGSSSTPEDTEETTVYSESTSKEKAKNIILDRELSEYPALALEATKGLIEDPTFRKFFYAGLVAFGLFLISKLFDRKEICIRRKKKKRKSKKKLVFSRRKKKKSSKKGKGRS